MNVIVRAKHTNMNAIARKTIYREVNISSFNMFGDE